MIHRISASPGYRSGGPPPNHFHINLQTATIRLAQGGCGNFTICMSELPSLIPTKPDELMVGRIRWSPCVQDIGDVITKTNRCVAFPNLYQHRVQPFRLEDPTKPGHRKILVFFLVDPTHRVLSTTDVGPQQREWATQAMRDAGQNSAFARLPVEILKMISNENDGAMSRPEAEKYREELMSERVVCVEENDRTYFGAVGPRRWERCGD